ncbi:MAG: hypothetical protein ACQETV_05005, partial [Actinomycetota bacterium]
GIVAAMDSSVWRRANLRASRRHGVLTITDAEALGVTWRSLRTRVLASGGLALQPGVVGLAGLTTYASRCLAAASAAGPAALVAGRSAAHCWGLTTGRDWPIRLVVPGGGPRPELAGVTAMRVALSAEDRAVVAAIPLTAVPRTLLDVAKVAAVAELEELAARAVQARHVTIDELHAYVADHAGIPGVRGLRRVLARLDRDGPTDSGLERRVRRWLAARGLRPEPGTYETRLASGRVVRFDIVFLPERVALEVDSVRFHGGPADQHDDAWRDREARASGWVVERVGERDLEERAHELEAHLRRVLEGRPAEGGGRGPAGPDRARSAPSPRR